MLSKFKVTEIYYLIYDFCKESIKIHLNTIFLGNIPRILYYKNLSLHNYFCKLLKIMIYADKGHR